MPGRDVARLQASVSRQQGHRGPGSLPASNSAGLCQAFINRLSSSPAVIYKTSLLHLQPRQMTIYLPEVRKISMDSVNLPVFNPNVFSEDEDDLPGVLSNIRSLVTSPRPLLVGRDGAQRVSSRGFQRVPVCLLPRLAKVWCLSKVGRCVRCHRRKVTRWHWSGKAGSYQSKDAGGGCDAAPSQSSSAILLPWAG